MSSTPEDLLSELKSWRGVDWEFHDRHDLGKKMFIRLRSFARKQFEFKDVMTIHGNQRAALSRTMPPHGWQKSSTLSKFNEVASSLLLRTKWSDGCRMRGNRHTSTSNSSLTVSRRTRTSGFSRLWVLRLRNPRIHVNFTIHDVHAWLINLRCLLRGGLPVSRRVTILSPHMLLT